MSIDINKLKKAKKTAHNKDKEIYRHIYKRCCNSIEIAANQGKDICNYIIPLTVVGLPVYNVNKCQKYIIGKLKQKKINVISKENILIINWKDI